MALTLDGTLGLIAPAANIAGTLLVNNAAALTTAAPQSGGVIQTIQTYSTTQISTSSSSFVTSGIALSITPKFSTSKILVHMCLGRVSGTNSVVFRILRNSSLYLSGDAAGSRPQLHTAEANQGRDANHTGQCMFMYFDSPASTSSQTYQVQVRPEGTYFGLNRSQNDSDGNNSYNGRASSTLILMEIAQ